MAESRSSSIQVIERMMQLLDVLAANPDAVSLKLLSSGTKLHPSTAHRILGVLIVHRMVERTEHGMYRLGTRLVELGNLAGPRADVARSNLQHAAAMPLPRSGEAVNRPLHGISEATG